MTAATATEPDVDIRLVDLTKRFEDVAAVDEISFEIGRGSFFAMLGPSGCGKTTTLRMIGGFEDPTAGRIELGGRDVSGLPPYKRDVNTVFQSYALFPHLTIFENVAFGLRRQKVRGDELRRRVVEALELVGLAGLERRKPRQLSGGQQQRIALARALVNRPRVLLLDEPLGALDLKLRKEMQLELKRIQHEVGITFVHVTHDQEEAMTMADRIVIMNHGKIEQLGAPSDLYEQPRDGVRRRLPRRLEPARAATSSPPDKVKLDGRHGGVRAARRRSPGGPARSQIGVRPEKLRTGGDESNRNTLAGTVSETAYIGVSTQYIVDTPAGAVTVYVQNDRPGAHGVAPGDRLDAQLEPGLHLRRRCRGGHVMSDRAHPPGLSPPRRRRAAPCLRSPVFWPPAARAATMAAPGTLPKTIVFSNWPLYIDVNNKKKTHPSLQQFEAHYHVNVQYIEDINDNDSFFGKIEGPLSQGQSVGRDIVVMTDSSGLPQRHDPARLAREARQVGHPEHQEPPADAAASELGPQPRLQPAVAVRDDRASATTRR